MSRTSATGNPVSYTRRGDVGVITVANPPVNALSSAVRDGLLAAADEARRDTAARAVVLIGDGRTFPAGADIGEFGKSISGAHPTAYHAAFETMDKPVVAAIHGTALGGGLELALACHYRIAVAGAKLGLPEVTLGVLPGGGGTQRLPRLVGLPRAMEMILEGKPVDAPTAQGAGLVDAIVEQPLLESAIAFARAKAEGGGPHPRASSGSVAPAPDLLEAAKRRLAKTQPHAYAPFRCLECLQAAASMPFEEALAFEHELFLKCTQSPQSKALVHAFFAERAASHVPGLDSSVEARRVERVSIVGAGTMGSGIAIACASAGLPVQLIEADAAARNRARQRIDDYFAAQEAKGRISAAVARERTGLVTLSGDLAGAAEADLVIEAVFEDLDLKRRIFGDLAEICRPETVLATNTSTLDVDAIAAAASGAPERVLGLHFFSPAYVMRLLEIVRGARTSPQTLATGLALAKRLGKVGAVAGVCFGFIGNRMLETYLAEAYYMLEEGALPEQVDAAIQDWGFAMGPFAMMDLAGNDVGAHIRRQHPKEFEKFGRYPRLPDLLCEKGRFGQKTGAGWYEYPEDPRKPLPSPVVRAMIEAEGQALQVNRRRHLPPEEIQERLLLALVNEGAKVLADGIAFRSSDIDAIYLNGYGFPRLRGGPMFHADQMGLPAVLDRLHALAARHGARWEPAQLLEQLVSEGRALGDLSSSRTSGRG